MLHIYSEEYEQFGNAFTNLWNNTHRVILDKRHSGSEQTASYHPTLWELNPEYVTSNQIFGILHNPMKDFETKSPYPTASCFRYRTHALQPLFGIPFS